jgi:hypothetical protein
VYLNVTKKTSLFISKTTNMTSRSKIIFSTASTTAKLAGRAEMEHYAALPVKLAHPHTQDRGYVQAVKENAGGNRDSVADAGFDFTCFC